MNAEQATAEPHRRRGGRRSPARRVAWHLAGAALTTVITLSGGGRLLQPAPATASSRWVDAGVNTAAARQALQASAQRAMRFEANQGQADSQVGYLSRGQGSTLFLTPSEAVLSLSDPGRITQGGASAQQAVRMQVVGGRADAEGSGATRLGKVSYSKGPTASLRDIPTYRSVSYRDVYRGIDLVYSGKQGQLGYQFLVAPGGDPKAIQLRFAGVQDLRLDERGDLVLKTAAGDIHQPRPAVYQLDGGHRRAVEGSFVLSGAHQVGFSLGAYDAGRPLVIGPAAA